MTPRKEHTYLCRAMYLYSHAYYCEGSEAAREYVVSDLHYDELKSSLMSLEAKHPSLACPESPLVIVGCPHHRVESGDVKSTYWKLTEIDK